MENQNENIQEKPKIKFKDLSGFLRFVIIGSFAGIVLDALYFLLGFLIGLTGL